MIVAVLLIVLVMAFIGSLVWVATRDAPRPIRGLLIMVPTALFLTLPSLALAIGAVS